MSVSLLALVLTGVLAATGAQKPAAEDSIEVKVRGTLSAGMMAIGGETTGYVITARGVSWELDFGNRQELRRKADGLDGKAVIVTGSLDVRPGVEMPMRSIVTVESLTPAAGATGAK